jgi:hypothetical protein
LDGTVSVIVWENPHALVRQGMEQVDAAYAEEGNSNKQEIAVAQKTTGIPENHEDSTGDDDAEHLDEAMEKDVSIEARCIKAGQDCRSSDHLRVFSENRTCLVCQMKRVHRHGLRPFAFRAISPQFK